ncbi:MULTISPECIES: electron transport complex protein RnfA [unclassified Clostridium]|uniref:electron transport complex protein RnfA n=1 Tax=unclassified Clostridium TaxID=2614128 RepID=UPI0025BA6673|nr:RnfABCDGE type electron transport complex subunit A [Clostridium sp.]MDU5105539.1 RnfABCDGE type electron transport complex subunit A [Clostridium sp.]MDY6228283.1 RnfABCDGE type electron transport complex subunit A [Clostridium sp.]
MVKDLILVLITTIFINNVLLSQFLGLCSFLGVSKKTETAVGMGGAVIFVITFSSAITNLIYNFILVKVNLEYMKTIVFIVVIAALVQLVEMILKKYIPSLYKALGVYLPLITTNCAVLGVALTNVQVQYTSNLQSFIFSIVSGLGTSIGYLVAILILAGIRERIEHNDIPESFKGMPIVIISAGLMAIAFMGFAGL